MHPEALAPLDARRDASAPPIDAWLAELGVEVIAQSGESDGRAFSRDVILDGLRRFDLRVTVAWVDGIGLSLWAYYGLEAMEIPKKTFLRMLRANFDYPFTKFAMTDDDRPMLMTELPPSAVDREQLARGLVRLTIVADRLLEATAVAVADRGILPDWSGRVSRNVGLLDAHRREVEAEMPAWEAPPPRRRRRGLVARLLGTSS
ncbi:MAG TPA: hypothetical protein VFM74_07575 [Candidatus Limnocylindria bacterium]|nr:hypothetical protein [Candidatus Limnocylindria bacterium]